MASSSKRSALAYGFLSLWSSGPALLCVQQHARTTHNWLQSASSKDSWKPACTVELCTWWDRGSKFASACRVSETSQSALSDPWLTTFLANRLNLRNEQPSSLQLDKEEACLQVS